jgi:hypothetical protein
LSDSEGPFTNYDPTAHLPPDVLFVIGKATELFQQILKVDPDLRDAIASEDPRELAETCFALGFVTFYTNMKEIEGGDDVIKH